MGIGCTAVAQTIRHHRRYRSRRARRARRPRRGRRARGRRKRSRLRQPAGLGAPDRRGGDRSADRCAGIHLPRPVLRPLPVRPVDRRRSRRACLVPPAPGCLEHGGHRLSAGEGDYVVVDSSYSEIARFGAANGYAGDLHEFTITPSGTALIIASNSIPTDLSAWGGPSDGTLLDGIVQEIHIESEAVLFEWHASEHIAFDESHFLPSDGLWDYVHLNSIDELDDASLLVSSRHTWAVYKIDRASGDIGWRLGGKRSDFAMGQGTQFAYQHDARSHPDGTISIFDDGAFSLEAPTEIVSRAILLNVDTTAMTAELARAEANPANALAFALGSVQLLADGGMFVGWGTVPESSEFAADGTLRFDASLPGGGWSYRAYRFSWTGRPTTPPALTARNNADGSMQAYVSWNGTTDVSHWQIHGGERPTKLDPLLTGARTGFETSIRIKNPPAYLAAVALDTRSRTLAASRVIRA